MNETSIHKKDTPKGASLLILSNILYVYFRFAFVIRLNIISAAINMATIAILLAASCDMPNRTPRLVTRPLTISATAISRMGLQKLYLLILRNTPDQIVQKFRIS